MWCILKCTSVRLCHSASRLIRYESISYTSLKNFQGRNCSTNNPVDKEESQNPSGKYPSSDKIPFRLSADWKWVIRGKYKVAAFSTQNNPATAIEHKSNQHWHRHKCPNCQTVYDHTHPYGSLHHPQHIKDCPKCKVLAPADLEIN